MKPSITAVWSMSPRAPSAPSGVRERPTALDGGDAVLDPDQMDQAYRLMSIGYAVSQLSGIRSARAMSMPDPIVGSGVCVLVELELGAQVSLQEIRAAVGNQSPDPADLPGRLVVL